MLLYQATCDDQCFAFGLEAAGFQMGVNRFLLRGFDKGAGVDDDRIGVRRLQDHLMASGFEHTSEVVGVGRIFRATQCHDGDFLHRSVMPYFLRSADTWRMISTTVSVPAN